MQGGLTDIVHSKIHGIIIFLDHGKIKDKRSTRRNKNLKVEISLHLTPIKANNKSDANKIQNHPSCKFEVNNII